MSSLIERQFNPEQKINKTVFRGSPNLLTTSDLNRQIESLKYQLDTLEERVGAQSDLKFSILWTTLAITVTVTELNYLICKGASFNPSILDSFILSNPEYDTKYYFCLIARKSLITYASDSTHLIAGASFEDGTSQEAADQEVYVGEYFLVTEDPSTLPEGHYLVAILASFLRKDVTQDPRIVKNYIPRYESIKTNLQIDSVYISEENRFREGMSYEEAFSVLYKLIEVENLVPLWQTGSMSNGKYTHNIKWRIKYGLFEVMILNTIRVDTGDGDDWEFTFTGVEDYLTALTGKGMYALYGNNEGYGAIRNAYIGQFTLQNSAAERRVGWASVELNDNNLPYFKVREMDDTGFFLSGYVDLKFRRPSVLSMCLT